MTPTTIMNSTILAIKVARAAPFIPILGAPSKPNINIAFKTPLTISPIKLPNIGRRVLPILLRPEAKVNVMVVNK